MARIQAALSLISFASSSDNPLTTPRVISVQLTDSVGGASVTKVRTVGIVSVNDVPFFRE